MYHFPLFSLSSVHTTWDCLPFCRDGKHLESRFIRHSLGQVNICAVFKAVGPPSIFKCIVRQREKEVGGLELERTSSGRISNKSHFPCEFQSLGGSDSSKADPGSVCIKKNLESVWALGHLGGSGGQRLRRWESGAAKAENYS